MIGPGVLKVYLIQRKKYAFRLRFQRAKAPQWVMDALNNISKSATIGFEDGQGNVPIMMKDGNVDDESREIKTVVENAERVLKLPDTQTTHLMETLVKQHRMIYV